MKYKETKIGIVPERWEVLPIKDITEVVTDYVANGSFASLAENVTYKDEEDVAVLIRLVDYNNNFQGKFVFIDEHAYEFLGKSKLFGAEIIISNVGANVGTVFRCPKLQYKMSLAPNSIMVKFKGNDDFYFHWLRGHNGQQMLKSIVTGSAQPKFNKTNFKEMLAPVPPIEEQNKIASILNSLDEKIELNKKINNNLEQQAQLLFKSWFVEFEPFNGTMPSDWEVVPFEKIVDFQNGYAFKSKELLNEPSSDCYQVFKQGHIARGGGFIPDGTKSWYPKRLASKLERFVLKKGDILMAMTDMKDNVAILGNTAIMPIDNEYIVNQRVGHLRANGYKGITYPFIYLLTNSTDFLIDLRSRANSGVQVNLSSAEIKASQTVLPSEKVNTAFSEITLPMFEAIISNQLENQRLAQLRDALLPKLMSGELDVSNIEL